MKTTQHKRGTAATLAAVNPVIPAGEICIETDASPIRFKIGDGTTAWNSLAYVGSSAASLTTGTLDAARLPTSAITASALAARQQQTTSVLDVIDRVNVNTSVAPVSGAVYWTFFTPSYSLTITQITMGSVSAASGTTLARMGLYTADASGNATLVARTASDTTLFASNNTTYARSLDSSGGYVSSYTLNAGSRYAIAVCIVATTTGTLSGTLVPSVIGALSPRVQGVRTGASDLVTSQTSAQYNGTVAHAYWARLS